MKQSRVCQSRYIPKSGESKPQCSVSPTQNNTPFYLRSGSDCKESACNVGDLGLIPGSERSPGEGNGNPLQYSCLENPMHRGAWWATVHGVTKESDTTERLSTRKMQSGQHGWSMVSERRKDQRPGFVAQLCYLLAV